jgi:hypothetical protein
VADKPRPARPWDLFNKNIGRVQTVIAEERFAICKACPKLLPTGNCLECGCFMSAKTKLPNAWCPLHKWEAVDVGYKKEVSANITTDITEENKDDK